MMDNFITQELKDEILLNNQLITTVERDISKPGKKSTQITLAKQQLEAARAALDMAMNTVDERASLFLVEKEPCPAPATSDKMKFCEIARKMIPLVDIIASEESSDGVKEAAQARLKEMSDEMVDYFYPPWGVSELFSPKPSKYTPFTLHLKVLRS